MNEVHKPTPTSDEIKARIQLMLEADPMLKAHNVKFVRLEQTYSIDSDANRVRLEMVFDIR